MANGSTRYIIKYVGDITDVLRKINIMRRATADLGRGGAKNLAPLAQSIKGTITPLNNAGKAAQSANKGFTGLFQKAIRIIPTWILLRAVILNVINLFKSSIKFLIDWEAQLAQVRIVGEASAGQIETLSDGLLNLQRTLGVSNKELGEGAKLFRQQGRAIEEIIPLLEATAKLSLITGQNTTQSVENLTAILKAFNIEARDSITIVDRLTAVTLQNAITAGDLTSALKQSASTAATFGVSLDELIGFITAIQTQTRDTGNTVGRSLRTIFVRLGTVAVDTAQQISKVPFFLDKMGQATTNNTPRLRNLTSVITELAANFRTLDTAQKAQLASAVAGVRRSNQISALFQNFEQFIRSQTQAQFGLGEADRAIGILTQTTTSKIEQVKGSWNSLLTTFADTGAIQGALDITKDGLDAIRFAFDPQGTFETSLISKLGEDVTALTREKAGIKGIFQEIQNLKQINEALQRTPDDDNLLGFSLVRVREVRNAIKRLEVQTGKDFKLKGLDEAKNTFELLDVFLKNSDRLTEVFLDLSVETNIKDLTAQLTSTTAQFRKDLEKSFGESFNSKVIRAIASLRGIKVDPFKFPSEVQNILDDLKNPQTAKNITDNLDKVRDSLQGLGLKPADLDVLLSDINKLALAQQAIAKSNKESRGLAKEELKVKEKAISEALVEEQIKRDLLAIELEGIRSDSTRLEIINKKIALLKNSTGELSKEQQQLRDNLGIELERVNASRRLAENRGEQERILSQLKAQGASVLQIEQQRLAFIRERQGAESVEAIQQENKIRQTALEREQSIQDQLVNLSKDLLALEGTRKSQILSTQIELEKNLGVEKEGIDALSQQVELLKALKSEQQAVNREQELSNLQRAVSQRRRDTSPFVQRRLDNREAELRRQAESVGLDPEDFLTNNDALITETEKNIQTLLSNINSTDRLTSSIESLTQRLLSTETRLISSDVARATVAAQLQGPRLSRPVTVQPVTPISPLQTPGFSVAPVTGGGRTSRTLIDVNVQGERSIAISLNATDAQIRETLREHLQQENQKVEDQVINQVISRLRNPNSPLTKQTNENIERF